MNTLNKNDKAYWSAYYANNKAPDQPSDFGMYIFTNFLTKMKPAKTLEFGFGNGRDLIFFNKCGVETDGIELAPGAAERLQSRIKNGELVEGSFGDHSLFNQKENSYNLVYSRFTLHSVNEEVEKLSLENAYRLLKPGGTLAIEARTIYDEFNGKGEKISDNEWIYEDHYRRFLDPGDSAVAIQNAGFRIKTIAVSSEFAIYKDQRPVCLRIIAQKPTK